MASRIRKYFFGEQKVKSPPVFNTEETYELLVELCSDDIFAMDNIAEAISDLPHEKRQRVIGTMVRHLETMEQVHQGYQGDQEHAVPNPYLVLAKAQLLFLKGANFTVESTKNIDVDQGSEHIFKFDTLLPLFPLPSTSFSTKESYVHLSNLRTWSLESLAPDSLYSEEDFDAELDAKTSQEVKQLQPGNLHEEDVDGRLSIPLVAEKEPELTVSAKDSISVEVSFNEIASVLNLVDNEELKMGFCGVLQKLAVYIMDIVTDWQKGNSPCPSTRNRIATKMNGIFNELYNTWFVSASIQLKQSILEAIAVICFLLQKSDLEEHFPVIVHDLQELYNTGIEHTCITEALSQILKAASNSEIEIQETWFQNLCSILFSQVFTQMDKMKTFSEKNSIAALHCFSLLDIECHDRMMVFLLEKVNVMDHGECITAILILQEINFWEDSAAPPLILLCRLLIIASTPYLQNGDLRATALSLLMAVSSLIHPSIPPSWNENIPKLLSSLEVENELSFPQQEWEHQLIMFVNNTVKTIGDESWNTDMILEIGRQLSRYHGCQLEQLFLYKLYGAVLQASNNGNFVKYQLNILLQTSEHKEECEQKAIAAGVGIAAREHLEDALEVLEQFGSAAVAKGNSGIVNIIKGLVDGSWKKTVNTVMICLGNVAIFAHEIIPVAEILIRQIVFYYNCGPTDDAWKLSFMKSVSMVSTAIWNSDPAHYFVLEQKPDLMNIVIGFIKEVPVNNKIKSPMCGKAMSCITHLSKLNPEIAPDVKRNLINVCMKIIFQLSAEEDGSAETTETQSLHRNSIATFKDMLIGFMQMNPTLEELLDILQDIDYWVTDATRECQENALISSTALFKYSIEELHLDHTERSSASHNLAHLIGVIAPRCSVPVLKIQDLAEEFCFYALQIQLHLKGFTRDQAKQMARYVYDRKCEDCSYDKARAFNTIRRIAQMSGEHLYADQFVELTLTLLDGLVDTSITCARAAALMLYIITQEHSYRQKIMVPDILGMIYYRLKIIQDLRVRQEVIQIVRILVASHLKDAVATLLKYPLPFDSTVSEMWSALGVGPVVNTHVLLLLLEKLVQTQPLKESSQDPSEGLEEEAVTESSAAINALLVMLLVPETKQLIPELFPQFLQSLLQYISLLDGPELPEENITSSNTSTTGKTEPFNPMRYALNALEILLLKSGFVRVIEDMKTAHGWDNLQSSQNYTDGISQLARFMIKNKGQQMPPVLNHLYPFLMSTEQQKRLLATTFFVEVLGNSINFTNLPLRSLLKMLFDGLTHPGVDIRIMCLRGIGNMALHLPKKAEKLKSLKSQLPSVLESFYDAETDVIGEALATTSKVLRRMTKKELGTMCLEIAMHISPYFEDESEKLQRSSLALFGDLMQLVRKRHKEIMREQIKNSLLVLILQMINPNPEISVACKYAVAQCGTLMDWDATWTRGNIMKQMVSLAKTS